MSGFKVFDYNQAIGGANQSSRNRLSMMQGMQSMTDRREDRQYNRQSQNRLSEIRDNQENRAQAQFDQKQQIENTKFFYQGMTEVARDPSRAQYWADELKKRGIADFDISKGTPEQLQQGAAKQADALRKSLEAIGEIAPEPREKYGQPVAGVGPSGNPEFQRFGDRGSAQIVNDFVPSKKVPLVSINKGEDKYATERMKLQAQGINDLGKNASAAYKSSMAMDRFTKASEKGTEGGAQPVITAVKNLLTSFGYDDKQLAEVRIMEQAINDVLANKMATLGARGLTDSDMNILKASLPRVATDRNSRLEVARILKILNDFEIDEYIAELDEEKRINPELAKRIMEPRWLRFYKAEKAKEAKGKDGAPPPSTDQPPPSIDDLVNKYAN